MPYLDKKQKCLKCVKSDHPLEVLKWSFLHPKQGVPVLDAKSHNCAPFKQTWPVKECKGWRGKRPTFRDVLSGASNHSSYQEQLNDRSLSWCKPSKAIIYEAREVENVGICARGLCTSANMEITNMSSGIMEYRQRAMRARMLQDESEINAGLSKKMGFALSVSHVLMPRSAN